MFTQACAELPNECCGLLAGNIETGQVTRRYPLVNTAASPVLYHNDAKDLFAAFRDMRDHGVEHVAIYHSHPTSEAVPSKTDRANNFYGGEMVHFIISVKDGKPSMRGWRLGEEAVREVRWEAI